MAFSKKRIVIFGGRLASWRRCLFVDVTIGLLDWKVKTAIAETEKKTTEANIGNRGGSFNALPPSLHGSYPFFWERERFSSSQIAFLIFLSRVRKEKKRESRHQRYSFLDGENGFLWLSFVTEKEWLFWRW